MQLKQLFADEDAVSPVIGVILMVAITVILAAVIGTFVLGLGDNVQDNGPTVNFQFEYDSATQATITHNGGQDVNSNNVEVSAENGNTESGNSVWGTGSPTTISTGDQGTFTHGAGSGDTIRIIWSSPSGGSSSTIGSSDIPS